MLYVITPLIALAVLTLCTPGHTCCTACVHVRTACVHVRKRAGHACTCRRAHQRQHCSCPLCARMRTRAVQPVYTCVRPAYTCRGCACMTRTVPAALLQLTTTYTPAKTSCTACVHSRYTCVQSPYSLRAHTACVHMRCPCVQVPSQPSGTPASHAPRSGLPSEATSSRECRS